MGKTIAIIDTGVAYTHPDLGGCLGPNCKVIGGYDFVNNDADPMDDHGHGTHVAATAAGNGLFKGIAPDAKILGYKVLSAGGSGSGTAIIAAQKLNRRWIGIDITHLAITVMRKRLEDSFPGIKYEVVGEPKDLEGARALARQDRYQFQWWALSLVNALPQGGERKKGADEGIDGVISFVDDRKGKASRVIVQVKSGHVGVRDIRELKAVIGDENLGLFITLEPPTPAMRQEAVEAGSYLVLFVSDLLHRRSEGSARANARHDGAGRSRGRFGMGLLGDHHCHRRRRGLL
jgi:hypothetical protein